MFKHSSNIFKWRRDKVRPRLRMCMRGCGSLCAMRQLGDDEDRAVAPLLRLCISTPSCVSPWPRLRICVWGSLCCCTSVGALHHYTLQCLPLAAMGDVRAGVWVSLLMHLCCGSTSVQPPV